METVTINSHGAMIEICSFLRPLWPFELPLSKWPSFCGIGDGLGDRLVPDKIHGVCISPECFQHDIEWSVCGNSWVCFHRANWRLYRNIRSRIRANLTGLSLYRAEMDALICLYVVNTVGRKFFKADPCDRLEYEEYTDIPSVKRSLKKLATVACVK